jgi:malate dehydrogenase (oxaloacetate-decarboxylating)
MVIAASKAIAGVISSKELNEDYIIPSVFDKRVAPAVSKAVCKLAQEAGYARKVPETIRPDEW